MKNVKCHPLTVAALAMVMEYCFSYNTRSDPHEPIRRLSTFINFITALSVCYFTFVRGNATTTFSRKYRASGNLGNFTSQHSYTPFKVDGLTKFAVLGDLAEFAVLLTIAPPLLLLSFI